jgi:hypothetical protein
MRLIQLILELYGHEEEEVPEIEPGSVEEAEPDMGLGVTYAAGNGLTEGEDGRARGTDEEEESDQYEKGEPEGEDERPE